MKIPFFAASGIPMIIFAALVVVDGHDVMIDILSPIDGEGYELAFPRTQMSIVFGEGPITAAVQSSPNDFEVCVDYDALEPSKAADDSPALSAGSSAPAPQAVMVRCHGLMDPDGLTWEDLSSVAPSEGRHTFVAWLRPKSGTRARSEAVDAVLWKDGVVDHEMSGIDGSFAAWRSAAPRWAAAASSSSVFYTSAAGWHLQALSPQPGFSYGGSRVSPQLLFKGLVGSRLCIDWDWHSSSSSSSSSLSTKNMEKRRRVDLVYDGGSSGYPERGSRECVELTADGGASFSDSPSPQDLPEGPKVFRAWMLGPPSRGKRNSNDGGDDAVLADEAERFVVEVPYSTYRITSTPPTGSEGGQDDSTANSPSSSSSLSSLRSTDGGAVDSDGGGSGTGAGKGGGGGNDALREGGGVGLPWRRNSMTNQRVGELWRELGLGPLLATETESEHHPSQQHGQQQSGREQEQRRRQRRLMAEVGARRKESMEASLDPQKRFEKIPGLSREGRNALQRQLEGNFDFGRVLAAADFSHWCRLPEYNCSSPNSLLSTWPRDIELDLLDSSSFNEQGCRQTKTTFGHSQRDSQRPTRGEKEGASLLSQSPQSSPSACPSVTVFTYEPGLQGVGDLHFLLPTNPPVSQAASPHIEASASPAHKLLPGEPFDLAIVSQTLEHLFDPVLALRGLYSRLAPGGFLFTSCPALSIPHMEPFHFASFTPMGLAVVLESAGFEVAELGLWGNADYAQKLFATKSWPSYRDLEHPVTNDPMVPASVWALARRPI